MLIQHCLEHPHVIPDPGNAPLVSQNLLSCIPWPCRVWGGAGGRQRTGLAAVSQMEFSFLMSWDEQGGLCAGMQLSAWSCPQVSQPQRPFLEGTLGTAPAGQHRGVGAAGLAGHFPLPKGPRSSFGTSRVIFHYKSPSPGPSSLLHEELRKQRSEPGLVHHAQRCPHAAATCSGHLGNLWGCFPGGNPACSRPWAAAPLPPFPSWAGAESQSHCPLSCGTLELIF